MLCESLTYIQAFPYVLNGEEVQQYTTVYSPPFEEFEVYRLEMPAGASTLVPANQAHVLQLDMHSSSLPWLAMRTWDALQGPSILLVQSGAGMATAQLRIVDKLLDSCPQLRKGSAYLVPAQTSVALTAAAEPLVAWIAAVHSQVFDDKFALPNAREGVIQTA